MRTYTLILVLATLAHLAAAQKNVLLEKFTNIHCGNCPNASLIIQEYQEEYPNLIWVSHYKQVSFDWSPLPNEESALLWADINVWGNPTAMFDRTPTGSDLITTTSTWLPRIDTQSGLPRTVYITFDNMVYDEVTRDVSFDVNLTFESVDQATEYRILAYAVEDDVQWGQKSYYNDVEGHPLEGLGEVIQNYKHQNVVRNMISGRWGTWDGLPETIEPGVTITKRFTHKIRYDYDERKTQIVVAVAKHHETDIMQRTILNSDIFDVSNLVTSSLVDEGRELSDQISIYPNPASHILTLEHERVPDLIQIIGIDGTVIKTLVPADKTSHIDLSELRSGVYTLQMRIGDQVGAKQLIVE